jgi:hypothetical protein
MSASSADTELWVCFRRPPTAPPARALVLSFLPPGEEDDAGVTWAPRLVSGRAVLQEVRAGARRAYLDLVARIGAAPAAGGRSLRQAMRGPGGWSRWWVLKTSEKDCVWDGDSTYSILLCLFSARAVADKHGICRVVVHGGPPGFAEALGAERARRLAGLGTLGPAIARGVVARLGLLVRRLHRWRISGAVPAPPPPRVDVLLEAHWDWSLGSDGAGGLRERYFADLPRRLGARGLAVGWFASIEPDVEVWQRRRRLRDVIAAASAHPEVILADRYLTPGDVLGAAFDLRYPLNVTRYLWSAEFRLLFRVDGLDLLPVMRPALLKLAWGAGVPQWELLATATARACRALRPKLLLTFLEMFLHSRALYVGARAGAPGVAIWAAQHAAYSSDKTFGVLDPSIELEGRPDGCAAPAPDGIFVMGELSHRLWRANGLAEDRVVLTGGLRYQRVAAETRPVHAQRPVSALLIGGMNTAADLDLCDAVTAAARGLDGLRLRLRDHPQYALSRKLGFRRFRGLIAVTRGDAEQDLADADLVLFTHSAFAEEALLRGIPTWQWLWPGFNTSVFLDLPVIPSFSSVENLRAALKAFLADPPGHRPDGDTQAYVLRQCFGPDPARASERIADHIIALVGEKTS